MKLFHFIMKLRELYQRTYNIKNTHLNKNPLWNERGSMWHISSHLLVYKSATTIKDIPVDNRKFLFILIFFTT